jgi:acetyltransferase-like isoleucine patch superfamily enzyme
MNERDQCTSALYTFNNTTCTSDVIAQGDRESHFRRIIAAAWIPLHHRYHRSDIHVGGYLGGNAKFAIPLHCDYGYNISIGDNITIGPCCRLLDSARIAVGKNTKIGSDVTISTLESPTNTKSRDGISGTEIAREVSIGENVYIGNSVTIEAGVRIGNNVIIRAGSVVSHVSTTEVLYACVS